MKIKYSILSLLFLLSGLSAHSQTYLVNAANHGQVYNTCSGTVYDNGGAGGNYAANQDYYITICAPAGQRVVLSFTQIQLENGYDAIHLYDGMSPADPRMLSFWNNYGTFAAPGWQVRSAGSCVTIRFYSDGSNQYGGFAAAISCEPIPAPPAHCNGNPPAANFCSGSVFICNDLGYCGNTSSYYTPDSPGNFQQVSNIFGGSIENNSWMSFEATGTDVTLDIVVSNCTQNLGVQAAIYHVPANSDCDGWILLSDPVYTTDGLGSSGSSSITASGLVPGNTYYLMIDGYAGDVCDYNIIPGAGVFDGISITPTQTICHGSNAHISIVSSSSLLPYTFNWTSSPVDPTLAGQTNLSTVIPTPPNSGTYTYYCHVTGGTVNCPVDTILTSIVIVLDSLDSLCLPFYHCNIAMRSSPSIICAGDPLTIWVDGGLSTPVMSNDFNDGTLGLGWSTTIPADFSNPCGPGPDGSICLWMGDVAPHPRGVMTEPFDLSSGGSVSFDMKYSVQTGDPSSSPCEGPDLANEGVTFRYSTNFGATWTNVKYYQPNGQELGANPFTTTQVVNNGQQTPFTQWFHRTYDLENQIPGAMTPNTIFQWIQEQSTSNVYDHWGLDNVEILQAPPSWNTVWTDQSSGMWIGDGPHTVYPNVSQWFYVSLTTPDGYTCIDSMWIEVSAPPEVTLNGLLPEYCVGDPPSNITVDPPGGQLTGNGIVGNTFDPTVAGTGTHDITYTGFVVLDAVQDTVFFDDFSSNLGWTGLGGPALWEGGPAAPSAGCTGNQDPAQDYSTSQDNRLAGNAIGGCYPNNLSTTYYLTSPVINLSGKTNVNFGYWRFAGCESNQYDKMNVQVKDAMGGWHNVWQNPNSNWSDNQWTLMTHNVSAHANNNPVFQVRFGMGPTDGNTRYMGWNLDDIFIIADYRDTICSADTVVQVVVGVQPDAGLGNNTSICIGDDITLTAAAGLTYEWSTGETTQSITVSPVSSTTYMISVSDGICWDVDSIRVTVNPLPTVVVQPANPVICPGTEIVLSASGASTYTWAPGTYLSGTTGSAVTATPLEDVHITVTGVSATTGCANDAVVFISVGGEMSVEVAQSAVAICSDEGITLTAYAPTGTEFTWSPATGLAATTGSSVFANPAATTTYTITGLDPITGCAGDTFITVTVNPLPIIVFADPAPGFCVGGSTPISASGAGPGGTYSWAPLNGIISANADSSTINVAPSSSQAYTVTGTNALQCSDTAVAFVTIYQNPTIFALTNPTICQGQTASLQVGGAQTYQWSPATGLSATTGSSVSANPNVSMTYTVIGYDANQCPDTTEVTITINPPPTVWAEATPPVICQGQSTQLKGYGAVNFQWAPTASVSPSTGSIVNANPTATTIYTVTGSDQIGCTNTATITVTLHNNPNVSASAFPNDSVCTGSFTQLTGSGANSYTWAPNLGLGATQGTTVPLHPTITAIYTVTGVDGNNCTGTNTITITVIQPPSISVTANPPVICPGDSSLLTAAGAQSFAWTPSATLAYPEGSPVMAGPVQSTTYTVKGMNDYISFSCSDSAQVTVNVAPIPALNINPATSLICPGSPVTLTASGAGAAGQYNWSPQGGLNTTTGAVVVASPTVTVTYTVHGTDMYGCQNTASAVVSVQDGMQIVSISPEQIICVGQSSSISVSVTGGSGNYNYTWSGGGTTGSNQTYVSPGATTTYTVTITDNCTAPITGSVLVTVKPLPVVNFFADETEGCEPFTVNFYDLSTPQILEWNWNFGDIGSGLNNTSQQMNPSHVYSNQGYYSVSLTVKSADNCQNSLTMSDYIFVNAKPDADFTADSWKVTVLDPRANFFDLSTGSVVSWFWNFGDSLSGSNFSTVQNPEHLYTGVGDYTVTLIVATPEGCKDTVAKKITILDDFTFYMPNAFRPDGDGLNDYFGPQGINIDYDGYEMYVFDRWGGVIFYSKTPEIHWNGTDKGGFDIVPNGVYVWMITFRTTTGDKFRYMGHVTVLSDTKKR